jgi:hypothetical protein
MRNRIRKRSFLENEQAVSEEFTSLPALSIVLIGFAVFIVLLAQTYIAYADRVDRLQHYQTADGLLQKLTNPECYFIRPGGLVDLSNLENDDTSFQHLYQQYYKIGYVFCLQLRYDSQIKILPESSEPQPPNRIAVSLEIGVYLNEAQTIPGTLTIVLWKGF